MKTERILLEINECVRNADLAGLNNNLDLLLNETSNEDACKQLAELLGNNYSQFKSEYLAKVLEIIIRKRPSLALVNHPDNFLFQTTISTGSIELYECYIEEALIPFLAYVIEEEHEIHYMELLNTAELLTKKLFEGNRKCIKGKHYNGAFSKDENNPNLVLLGEPDYIVMEDVVERYNALVGRGLIISDLNKRSGLNV